MVIETHSLNFYFSEQPIVKSLSTEISEHSILVLGLNNAGKTTTIKLLLSLPKMQEGGISVFGNNCNATGSTITCHL